MKLTERIERQRGVERVQSSLPVINACTRGGYPLGKRVVLGGAPGAGKTGLMMQEAITLARQGVHVTVLATDENADALAIRAGQYVGGDRTLLERGDEHELERVRATLDALPLRLLEDSPIEDALASMPVTGPRALCVDSLQTARSRHYKGNGKRAQIETSVKACKEAARAGCLVIMTSELARTSYAKAEKRGSVNRLQGFKGSGDIEYDVDLALFLVTYDKGRTVEAEVVKSRLGPDKPTFTLTAYPARASLTTPMAPRPTPNAIARPRASWGLRFYRTCAALVCDVLTWEVW